MHSLQGPIYSLKNSISLRTWVLLTQMLSSILNSLIRVTRRDKRNNLKMHPTTASALHSATIPKRPITSHPEECDAIQAAMKAQKCHARAPVCLLFARCAAERPRSGCKCTECIPSRPRVCNAFLAHRSSLRRAQSAPIVVDWMIRARLTLVPLNFH